MRIDARGMRCPWPALRLGRALREGHWRSVEILADDPAAETELRALAELRGAAFETLGKGHYRIALCD